MSCNGCRVLRKGCSDDCMLRHCLQWIDNPRSQAHATVFVAKFFGRAGLMSFVSNVPTDLRSALFQSLLFEAVGRTINPVNGVVGLLWTGNWHLCQLGVEKVLRDGALSPLPEFFGGVSAPADNNEGFGSVVNSSRKPEMGLESRTLKRKARCDVENSQSPESLVFGRSRNWQPKKQRAATPSEESETTTVGCSAVDCGGERKLLRLFF